MRYWTGKNVYGSSRKRLHIGRTPVPVCIPCTSSSITITRQGCHWTRLCFVPLICFLNLLYICLLTWRHLSVWGFLVVASVCLVCLFFLLHNSLIIYTVCELPCLALPVQKSLRRTDSEPKYCYKLWLVKQLSYFKCLRDDCRKTECSGI